MSIKSGKDNKAPESPDAQQQSFINEESDSEYMASEMDPKVPPIVSKITSSVSSLVESIKISPTTAYEPVEEHWLFKNVKGKQESWIGFSHSDSAAIEKAYQQILQQPSKDIIVQTNGKRHDVYVKQRKRKAFYWKEEENEVKRGTYFYKTENGWVPYDEAFSVIIENLIEECAQANTWPKSISVPSIQGTIVAENMNSILHYPDTGSVSSSDEVRASPKPVSRGMPNDIPILPEEIPHTDHLVLVVQGIGSYCDLSFHTVNECVDGFRDISARLTKDHFQEEVEAGRIGKIEFLPLDWHSTLHSEDVGFDRRMASITLPSLPLLRNFTNDTLLDILLYNSPLYGETIINNVVSGLNKLFHDFAERNPDFKGGVSVAGHSLGSLILFDILSNPKLAEASENDHLSVNGDIFYNCQPEKTFLKSAGDGSESPNRTKGDERLDTILKTLGLEEFVDLFISAQFSLDYKIANMINLTPVDLTNIGLPTESQNVLLDYLKNLKNELTSAEKEDNSQGDSLLEDVLPQLNDISIDSAVAPSESLSSREFTSSHFSLNPLCSSLSPYSRRSAPFTFPIPKLDFQPACFFAMGSPVGMFLVVRGFSNISKDFHFRTCPAFFNIFHPYDPVAFRMEPLIDPDFSASPVLIPHHKGRKRMHRAIPEILGKIVTEFHQTVKTTLKYLNIFPLLGLNESNNNEDAEHAKQDSSDTTESCRIGALNGGRRIDYVLQEKPYEAFVNSYLFTIASHATYWHSDDTVLMMLKELYALCGVTLQQNIKEDVEESVSEHEIPVFVPSVS